MSKQTEEVAEAFGVIGRSVESAISEFNARMVEAISRVSQSESDTDAH